MARIVYLPTVEPASWLLWTIRGDGSCLRDYRFAPTKEIRAHSSSDINALLLEPGNFWEMSEDITYKDLVFWREQISLKNAETHLPPITEVQNTGGKQRLLSVFNAEIVPLLAETRESELEAAIRRWIDGFAHIVNKEQFNHWDNSDATGSASATTGFGWTSVMLEYCRANGILRYIQAGRPDLDFAIIAAEIALGLSSKSNPFQPGQQDYIEPDGIGVRQLDGSFLILEMKGPQDDHDLFAATLQALCGALAVYAKRDMIVRLAKTSGQRRPVIANPALPSDRPSLGLYITVVPKPGEQVRIEDDARLAPAISFLQNAFPPLREVIYFVIGQEQLSSIGTLPFTAVFPS